MYFYHGICGYIIELFLASVEYFINIQFIFVLGFILYFAFMSAFFWLNIVAFNVWRTVW